MKIPLAIIAKDVRDGYLEHRVQGLTWLEVGRTYDMYKYPLVAPDSEAPEEVYEFYAAGMVIAAWKEEGHTQEKLTRYLTRCIKDLNDILSDIDEEYIKFARAPVESELNAMFQPGLELLGKLVDQEIKYILTEKAAQKVYRMIALQRVFPEFRDEIGTFIDSEIKLLGHRNAPHGPLSNDIAHDLAGRLEDYSSKPI